jgi:hypothetical protein
MSFELKDVADSGKVDVSSVRMTHLPAKSK